MNPSLQFHCPACGTMLAVPMAAAGSQGPCPRCAGIITAPVPHAPKSGIAPSPPLPSPPIPSPPSTPGKAPATGLQGGAYIAILVLSCLLASVLCFGGGFLLGRLERLQGPLAPPAAKPNAKAVENPTREPKKPGSGMATPAKPQTQQPQVDGSLAAVTGGGEKPAVESDVDPGTPEEAALRAFLTAPGWAPRSAHVLTPDRVRGAMAAHAETHGDGPIRFEGVSVLQDTGISRVFLVRTPAIPDGFPVVLSESGGGWVVDWEGFIEFHDDAFRSFADKSPSGQQSFRLLVNPATRQPDADGVIKYRLSPPMPARERVARVEEGSTAHARLREIFEAQEKADPQTYRSLMADRGLPLMVTVSKRPAQGGSQLWIERVIAAGWNPAIPPSE